MPRNYGFPVGTRVQMIKEDPNGHVVIGETGTVCDIVHISQFKYQCNIGVEWDKGSFAHHSCNDHCRHFHGRYVPHICLQAEVCDFGEIDTDDFTVDALFNMT